MTETVKMYVAKTSTGIKVEYRDHRGLSDGLFVKGYTRYFYGDSAQDNAIGYAERKAEQYDDYEVKTAHNIEQ